MSKLAEQLSASELGKRSKSYILAVSLLRECQTLGDALVQLHQAAKDMGLQSESGAIRIANAEVPARHPSPRQQPRHSLRRRIETAAKENVRTILDNFYVLDGRSIGEVRYFELERLETRSAHEARLFRSILNHGSVSDEKSRVRDFVSPKHMESLIDETRAENV